MWFYCVFSSVTNLVQRTIFKFSIIFLVLFLFFFGRSSGLTNSSLYLLIETLLTKISAASFVIGWSNLLQSFLFNKNVPTPTCNDDPKDFGSTTAVIKYAKAMLFLFWFLKDALLFFAITLLRKVLEIADSDS